MKRISMIIIVLLAIVWGPVVASAAQVVGTVQGFTCATEGWMCPVDGDDPIVAGERLFVVVTENRDCYLVPNLNRGILARHVCQKVRVTGELNDKYDSIKAESLEVWENGSWKTTWPRMQAETWRPLYKRGM
jgi:hypothetical protein